MSFAPGFSGPDPRVQLDAHINAVLDTKAPHRLSEHFHALGNVVSADQWLRIVMARNIDAHTVRALHEMARSIASEVMDQARLSMMAGDASLDSFDLPPRLDTSNRVRVERAALTVNQRSVLDYLVQREIELAGYIGDTAAEVVVTMIEIAVHQWRMTPGDTAAVLSQIIGLNRQRLAVVLRLWRQDLDLGMTPGAALRRLQARTNQQRLERSKLVMEHEMARAWNRGTLESVKQRQADGIIDPATVKVWITVGDDLVCPICAPLHLQVLSLDSEFDNVQAAKDILDGIDPTEGRRTLRIALDRDVRTAVLGKERFQIRIHAPPAHIRCRCVLAYKRAPIAKRERILLVKSWVGQMVILN